MPPPKKKNRAGGNPAVLQISKDALATPLSHATEREALQARRLASRFFLSTSVAATIARLHFGEVAA
ncbi:hypothetical protein FFI89_017305 [Bradyrhizobium sp. KBS0727]|uniref:hypothetical protein n=1 Tax=unclassified Bradyrhizobium TaxID=2631580 RepID=UPI00110EAAAF|nr:MULTISPECIES: hypothetical protein [unclassified Bradyrhizobium]QDW38745.1 hypothetical protein FFI71_017300 [Bradyrhizobium sp. KBS0725]QDW45349.1 hypothetical protein FFI89_017305 [Bradyrhizobium sp. KBS0727]